MDAMFSTVTQRFGISRGAVVERPRNITVVEGPDAPGSRRNRGNLYILVEVLGGLPDPQFTLEQLAEVICSEYGRATGSITGAIGAALRAANDWLFEENLNSPREQRGVAGVSCAVLRDGELFVGQLGPALAYLWQADGQRRLPEDSPWLRQAIPSEAERAASPPLGVRRVVEPQFDYARVGAGDRFVLASSSLARVATGRVIAEALEQGPDGARQQVQMLAHDRDVNVLIVGLEAAGAAPPRSEGAAAADLRPDAAPEPLLPRPATRPHQARRAGLGANDVRQAVSRPVGRAGRSIAALFERVLPDRTARAVPTRGRAPAAPPKRSNARTVATLVILIPVLALSIVFVTRYQYERSRRAQVAELLRRAGEAQATVLTTGQREVQREALRQAIALIDQALEMAPQEPAAAELRQKVMEELDVTCDVQRLYTMWELANLGAEPTNPPELSRIVVHGQDVFVLDRGADRVYHRVLSPAGDALEVPAPDALLVAKGESRGAITVGELIDMVWMPTGGQRMAANLLIVERNGSLLEWDPARGLSVLPVADAAAWKRPLMAGAYSGNLYLLDPQQNRIIKYLPTVAGYTDPPLDYLVSATSVDLSGAVDMAIDGNIYVLLADGSILKFLSGIQQAFRIVDLDTPLKNPVAIAVSGEDDAHGYIYVADAGLARVVQFTKHGEFIRQFKAAEGQTQLDQLRGLLVDEAGQRMYLTSGSRLYMAPLSQSWRPAPSATPQSTS